MGKPVSSICKQTPYPSLYIDYGVESSNHNGFLKILTLIKFNYFRIWFLNKSDLCISTYKNNRVNCKENRLYIRVEFRQSLGMNFFCSFQPEREFKVNVNVHKLYAVEYINTVCSLDYPFQFRIFKLYNELSE